MDPRRLDYIDALRGIAVTGVILSHAKNLFPDMHWRLIKLTEFGAHGVQLFFVASALTLMLSWHARNDGAVPFYLRRLFRIAPMFWLATALYGGLNAVGLWPDGSSDPAAIAATAFFVHGWAPDTINLVVPGGWTIGVEMTFYAVFPVIAASVTTLPRAMAFAIGSALLAGVANTEALRLMATVEPSKLGFFVYYWFPNSLQVFAFGCLSYHMLRFSPVSNVWSAVLLAGAGSLALYCAWWPVPWYPTWVSPISRELLTAIASVLLALALARTNMTWLVNRVTCFVGRVSFSAYLVHFLVLYPFVHFLGPLHASSWVSVPVLAGLMAVILGITVWLSAMTYQLVERPCIQAGNRFIRGWLH